MENHILLDSVAIDAIEKMAGKESVSYESNPVRDASFFAEDNPWRAVRQWLEKGIYEGDEPNASYFNGWSELIECLKHNLDRDQYHLALCRLGASGSSLPEASRPALLNVIADYLMSPSPKPLSVEEHRQFVYGLMRLFKHMDQNVDDQTPVLSVAHALNLQVNRLLSAMRETKEPGLI
jgi:hypothetical protein